MYFTIKRSILVLTLFVTLVGWLSVLSAAQQNAIRIGVAVMQNQAGRSVPGTLERDRLVQALNHMKPDKKTHVQVEAVALDAMTGSETDDEAASKKCAYVVLTTLTELRSSDDPYQHQPNTIETKPNSQWSNSGGPEYRVTVVYKLYRTGGSEVAGSRYSTQVAMNEIDAVSQVMDRIASRVADEVKKGPPAPMTEEPPRAMQHCRTSGCPAFASAGSSAKSSCSKPVCNLDNFVNGLNDILDVCGNQRNNWLGKTSNL